VGSKGKDRRKNLSQKIRRV